MKKKSTGGCLVAILQFLVITPMWMYLLYQILTRVNATDLMWFVYWAYVPMMFVAIVMGAFVQAFSED